MKRGCFRKQAVLATVGMGWLSDKTPALEATNKPVSNTPAALDAALVKNWLNRRERSILGDARNRYCDHQLGEEIGWLVSPFLNGFYYGYQATRDPQWVEHFADWADAWIQRGVKEPDGFVGCGDKCLASLHHVGKSARSQYELHIFHSPVLQSVGYSSKQSGGPDESTAGHIWLHANIGKSIQRGRHHPDALRVGLGRHLQWYQRELHTRLRHANHSHRHDEGGFGLHQRQDAERNICQHDQFHGHRRRHLYGPACGLGWSCHRRRAIEGNVSTEIIVCKNR